VTDEADQIDTDIATEVEGIGIADLPKISLHDHLDGGLRPATVLELGRAAGLDLPADDAPALGAWFAEKSDSGSLVEYLKTFDLTIAVMQTEEGLARVAREAVLDLAADGVIYGELRWAPEQHLSAGLTLDQTVEAVQRGIEEGEEAVRAAGGNILVQQLVSAMRQNDRGVEIAELALRHRDAGVAGFDIAGPEAGFPPSRLKPAFDLLLSQGMPITVHAGEADGIESIRSAIVDGHALRLGHGVRIREDVEIVGEDDDAIRVRLGRLAEWVKDRRIPLEVSPSSNLQTGAFAAWGSTMEEHPIDLLDQLGFAVTVNTDNRLMSGTSLTRELGLLVDAFDYGLDDLLRFQLTAAEGAFLPTEDRATLADDLREGFGAR
jgi:adenosine deaminase